MYAHKRVYVHNVRDISQARLESKLNAQFLLNKHGDLYFLLRNFGVKIVLLIFKRGD